MSSRRTTRDWLSLFVLFVVLGSASSALADAFDDARKIFKEAEDLYAGGKYGDAAERYTAAYRTMRSPLLFFNIAQARRLQFKSDGNHKNLVAARRQYERFLAEAEPGPKDKARAEANLAEVEKVSVEEAQKRFEVAEEAMRLGKFEPAIEGYESAYELSRKAGILFNLSQAHRKQFAADGKLDHLARAEDLLLTYRREAKTQVAPETIDELLADIRKLRAEYHRKRETEAQSKEPAAMRLARERYQQGDAAAALEALTGAEKVAGNGRNVLVQMYRLRGQAAALAKDQDGAIEAFKRYLAIEPAADTTGIREDAIPAFDAAKEFWKGKSPLQIEHLPPGRVPPGAKVTIAIRTASDPLNMISHRVFRYRRQGDKKWQTVELAGQADSVKLPAAPPPLVGKQYRMEYFIVALDANRGTLDSIGSDSAPLAYLVTEDAIVRPPPVYKRWWFWAGIGVIAAGSVATIAIIRDDGLPDAEMVGDVTP